MNWNHSLKEEAQNLQDALQKANLLEVQQNLAKESLNDFAGIVKGINHYIYSENKRKPLPSKIVWHEGSTQLHDYGGNKDWPVVLLVPSLINRAYIFDLSENRSMVKFLREKRIHCFMLDWGIPGKIEADFHLEEYISRLNRSIAEIYDKTGKPVTLFGYCMGGLKSIAACLSDQEKIKGLALIATPWDFQSSDIERTNFSDAMLSYFIDSLPEKGTVSGHLIYMMFYFRDPWVVNHKYSVLAEIEKGSEEEKEFIERECWLNDHIPLTYGVAKDCFVNWAVKNVTMKNRWFVNGMLVDPRKIKVPTFIAIPKHDIVVPPLSSVPLNFLISGSEVVYSQSGHISMVAGKKAKEHLWLPFANWLHSL